MELFREIYPVAFLTKYLEHNLRPDGRLLDEPRPLSVSSDVLRSAMASSFVKLGRTTIMVAIKGELGPLSDCGLVVQVELPSICNGERPGLVASGQASFLETKLRDLVSVCSVASQLRVDEERDVGWILTCDVCCVDDDGCVLDAMTVGLVAALESLVLPALVWNKSQFALAGGSAVGRKLELKVKPRVFSFSFVDKWLICDPDHEEEEVSNSLVSVGLGTNGALLCVEKRGGHALSKAQLEQCVKVAMSRK